MSVQQRRWTLADSGQWQIVPDEDAKLLEVIAALKSGRHATQKEIARTLGLEPYQVTRLIQRAEALHLLKRGQAKQLLKVASVNQYEEPEFEGTEGPKDNPDF
jgi:hypothetical protein